MDKFYVPTPIYYASGKLHIGHSYSTVAADTAARYKRMRGYDVMFLTGSDEHGQKVEEKAREAGVTPQQYVDDVVSGFKELWQLLNISYDRFIRTTDDYHVESVKKIFKQLYDSGDIYKGRYEGLYCTPCEAFWSETQLVDGKCPDCGREVKKATEEAYFFRLSAYAGRLLAYYDSHPEFIQPVARKNEMVNNFIKPGLEDLCVSRTSFQWGIPVDFDPGHVVYVWVDALTNYITALGYGNDRYGDYDKFWPADIHMVGKEIVRFHTIVWPAMLMALGLPLPKKVFGHGWLLLEGGKMSKSKGNVVDPHILCSRYGVDAIRYFLLREIPFGSDGVFSNEALIHRINADLANDLGNLLSRSTAMCDKYFGGEIPEQRAATAFDGELETLAKETKAAVEDHVESLEFSSALAKLWAFVSRTNKYIDETTPWALAKDESRRGELASVIYHLCESLRIIAVLLTPFMPSTGEAILSQLSADARDWDSAGDWGRLSGKGIQKSEPLFPRIDEAEELKALEALMGQREEKKAEIEGIAQIGIDDFTKVELRTARVAACEPVKKAKKLLKLTLDDGTAAPRTVVSGIAPWYRPEDLVDHTVIVVANLKPAVLCGVESNGMILAADNGENDVRVIFADGLNPGSKVR